MEMDDKEQINNKKYPSKMFKPREQLQRLFYKSPNSLAGGKNTIPPKDIRKGFDRWCLFLSAFPKNTKAKVC